MSLINEALKRAKEAQQPPPATSSGFPQLRAVETAHMSPTYGLLPSLTLAVVAMLTLVIVWQWLHRHHVSTTVAIARTAEVIPPPLQSPAPAKAPAIPAKAIIPPPAKTVPPPVVHAAPTKPVATPQAPAQATAQSVKPAVGGAVPAEPTSKPITLTLQAIVFHPTRPSAVISGRTLFIGDHIGDFRVSAISHRTVTVAKPGKTNVLTLRD